ncbi:unnamed protein product [Larinioides sclopetarius]|uniref:Uncharacterized protein n=1 Tax=Larinioides sclopetarius TaxID=280406 RepID=A0AAV1Z069_9ARAC
MMTTTSMSLLRWIDIINNSISRSSPIVDQLQGKTYGDFVECEGAAEDLRGCYRTPQYPLATPLKYTGQCSQEALFNVKLTL